MPIKNRKLYPGAVYHVFDRGVAKQPIFFDDEDRAVFIQILDELYLAYNFIVHAYCLMGNHFHLLIQTFDPNLPELMQRFMGRYVKHFNPKYERPGYLYQGRYNDRNVESDLYFATLFRYLALNPVEDRPELKPEDCIWSSYYDYVRGMNRERFLRNDISESLFARYKMGLVDVHEFVRFDGDILQEKYPFNDDDLVLTGCEPVLIPNEQRTDLIMMKIDDYRFLKRERKQLLSYLLKTYTTHQEEYIANLAGYQSTSSIHNSCKFVKQKSKTDNRFSVVINSVESQIWGTRHPKLGYPASQN